MDSGSDEGKVWATSVASGRPDSSVLLRKPGDVFDLEFSIGPPGHGKQQVREAVDPSDDIRADRFSMRQLDNLPLSPPRDRSGHVESGSNFGAAGKHKSGHGCISRFHFIDELLHFGHRGVGETDGLLLVGGALRGGQIGTNVEQATLAQVQDGMHPPEEAIVIGGDRAHGQANGGVGFINRPVGGNAGMIFGDPSAAKEPGGPVIARSCVELHRGRV